MKTRRLVCVTILRGLTWDLVQPISLISTSASLFLPWAARATLTCFWSLDPDKLGSVSGALLSLLPGALFPRSLQGSLFLSFLSQPQSHLLTRAFLNCHRPRCPLPLAILDSISLFYFLEQLEQCSRKWTL